MFQCDSCRATEAHDEYVSEVFQIYGKPILVENIPAIVCSRCGEATFSRETTEKIRQMLHGNDQPTRAISVDVYAFK